MTTPPSVAEIVGYTDYFPARIENAHALAKRERRDLRRKLMKAVEAHLSLRFFLTHTAAQHRAAARTITDQLLAGKNPGLVETLP